MARHATFYTAGRYAMPLTMRLDPSLGLLFQQGLQARAEGRLGAAQTAFAEILRRHPEQADALLLLAELAQSQASFPQAQDLLERALRANPTQPHAWFRLGEVQEEMGRAANAEQSFARAVALKPDHVLALYNRARLQRLAGDAAGSAQSVAQALSCQPPSMVLLAQMLQLQALLQDEAGDLDAALATLDQALTAAPHRAALHHNRGVLLQRIARPAEALAAHDRALALGLDAADAHYNRGNSLQSLGRSADAAAAYRVALSRDGQHALALYDLARLRWRLGDAAFTAELDAAAAAAPGSAVAPGIKGRLLLRAERYEDAAAAYGQAVALDGSAAGYFDGLGQALSRLGRFDQALQAHGRAVELAPAQPAVHINHAGSLLQAGQTALAAQAAETAVRLNPLDQQAWALLGLAWRVSGDAREAWLNDYRRHVRVFDLAPPPGWTDAESFNRALAVVLEKLHTDLQAPIDQTLRRGSQTLGNLFEQALPLVTQLKAQLAGAIDRYIAELGTLSRDDSHPLLGRISPRWRFSDSWSSRLRSGGFHTHHVHPHGWISSAYYAALPPAVADVNVGSQDGCIAFGTPDIEVAGFAADAQRVERPRVGRLVLFPSFMWHGTRPFVDAQARLTVAFDVVPFDGASTHQA